eukprot:TRINITY_DN3129_c0_g1_i3.p1 TRINITY_DN3129_c0_g1~~TRINITY_DN3129_c0_g1_i3.p1  ORF type:complete len:241 (-),score=-20.50 TRINITY_DN3129_c0_g1_i3:730-1452(-)
MITMIVFFTNLFNQTKIFIKLTAHCIFAYHLNLKVVQQSILHKPIYLYYTLNNKTNLTPIYRIRQHHNIKKDKVIPTPNSHNAQTKKDYKKERIQQAYYNVPYFSFSCQSYCNNILIDKFPFTFNKNVTIKKSICNQLQITQLHMYQYFFQHKLIIVLYVKLLWNSSNHQFKTQVTPTTTKHYFQLFLTFNSFSFLICFNILHYPTNKFFFLCQILLYQKQLQNKKNFLLFMSNDIIFQL